MSGLLDGFLGNLLQDQVSEGLANTLGLEKSQTQSALSSAVPILIQAMSNNASTEKGEQSLQNALKNKDTGLLDNLTGYLSNPDKADGTKIIDHILGGKRSTVERYIGQDSGLSSGSVNQLLSSVAPLLLSTLAGQQGSSSGIGSLLSGLTGEMKRSSQTSQSQNVIEKLLDQNNDGNIADDVAKIGMSFLGKLFKK